MRAGPARIDARRWLLAACVVLIGASQLPPTAMRDACLLPERSSPAPGTAVGVALHDGSVFPGPRAEWPPAATREFFLVDAAGRLDLRDRVPAGNPPMPRLTLRSPGTTVVALVSAPAYAVIPAGEFQGRLKTEGQEDILEMRATMRSTGSPGRDRFRHYLKTLLNAGGAASNVALANLSLVLEIIPESQPASVRPGGRLPVRVLFEGMPYGGGLLCARHDGAPAKSGDRTWCGRLDGSGRVFVPIEAPGWQLLRTVRTRALAGDDRADWVSYRAALTFEVSKERSTR